MGEWELNLVGKNVNVLETSKIASKMQSLQTTFRIPILMTQSTATEVDPQPASATEGD